MVYQINERNQAFKNTIQLLPSTVADWDSMSRVITKTRGRAFRTLGRAFQTLGRAFSFLLNL